NAANRAIRRAVAMLAPLGSKFAYAVSRGDVAVFIWRCQSEWRTHPPYSFDFALGNVETCSCALKRSFADSGSKCIGHYRRRSLHSTRQPVAKPVHRVIKLRNFRIRRTSETVIDRNRGRIR